MAKPETLAKVKQAIRRSHDKLDGDLMADIDACLADLRAHGINGPKAVETDPLIYNAIKNYCKEMDSEDPAEAARWRQCYRDLRDSLKAAEGYGWTKEVAADD